jgi:hypothetical protein
VCDYSKSKGKAMKRSVRCLVALLPVLLVCALSACGNTSPESADANSASALSKAVVARVGQAEITVEELVAFADTLGLEDSQPSALEQLIGRELALQKAAEYGLSVTEDEVQAELDSYISFWFNGDQSVFDQNMSLDGTDNTIDRMKMEYREVLLSKKVYDKVTSVIPEEEKERVWNDWVTAAKAEVGVVYMTGTEPSIGSIP